MGRVTLTFDNGPDAEGTPLVLEVLRQREVTATFFVLGKQLATAGGLDLARRIAGEGHALGNHTYTHETPLGLDPRPDLIARELEATEALLDRVWDGPRLFRPFGGGGKLGPHLLRADVVRWLEQRAYTCVLWTSVPGDFDDPDGWTARALADVAAAERSLVVLHDAFPRGMRHLDAFLVALRDAGHTITDELPPECLPLEKGQRRPGLEALLPS